VYIVSAVIALAGCALDERVLSTGPSDFGVGSADAGGGTARLELAPGALDFGRVTMGFLARERILLRNTGSARMGVPAVGWSAQDADFGLLQNACLSALEPGDTCELRVSLLPSRAESLNAVLRVQVPEGGSSEVPLHGEGLVAGNLIFSPAPGSFDDLGSIGIGSTAAGVFRITNSGALPAGALSLYVSRPEFALQPPDGIPGECQPGATLLAPGQACDLRVLFNPTDRGPLEATLTAETAGTGSISTRLSGEGLAPGLLVAGTSTLDFRGVVLGDGALRTLVLSNAGDEPVTLLGARLEPPPTTQGFSIESSYCGAGRVLEGGTTCSVQLEFRPGDVAQEVTADLVAEAAGAAAPLRVPLRGTGLESGRLELTAEGDGLTDFGEVLLDDSQVRVFRVLNPTPQPSGVLSLSVSDGFGLAPSSTPDACIEGATSLAQAQSCTIGVSFSPAVREPYQGSLTVVSALAGAKSLPLTARGIVPALLGVEPELDFGRVFTNAPSSRTLAVVNRGDRESSPPTFELSGPPTGAPSTFTFTSTCDRALAAGERCELSVSFAPTQALPYAANLTLASDPGGVRSVLFLGEGLVPGSLVLVAAEGATPDFGDVAIGTTTSRDFTLTNPGAAPSGPLVFQADDDRFVVSEGDCNQGDPAGLVNGASCTFSVQFSPSDSSALTSNLVVQSAGAGLSGVELTGRGRQPATLEATGNRDLGRANIGQATLTSPENEFVWTLNNTGDLPSSALVVANDNMAEFVIGNDLCNGAVVPGLGSCTLSLRFVPAAVGARTATVTVSDPIGERAATLALTGTGVQLAALGESCVNAECAEGSCSAGVCCDVPCDGTCQVCMAGVCTDQANREPCGDGNARCFGVDRCSCPKHNPAARPLTVAAAIASSGWAAQAPRTRSAASETATRQGSSAMPREPASSRRQPTVPRAAARALCRVRADCSARAAPMASVGAHRRPSAATFARRRWSASTESAATAHPSPMAEPRSAAAVACAFPRVSELAARRRPSATPRHRTAIRQTISANNASRTPIARARARTVLARAASAAAPQTPRAAPMVAASCRRRAAGNAAAVRIASRASAVAPPIKTTSTAPAGSAPAQSAARSVLSAEPPPRAAWPHKTASSVVARAIAQGPAPRRGNAWRRPLWPRRRRPSTSARCRWARTRPRNGSSATLGSCPRP